MINPNKIHQIRDAKIVNSRKGLTYTVYTVKYDNKTYEYCDWYNERPNLKIGDTITAYIKFSIIADQFIVIKANKKRGINV